MINTGLDSTHENLYLLAMGVMSKESKDYFNNVLDTWNKNAGVNYQLSWKYKADLLMECYYTYDQKWIIVKIVETGTWGLIEEKGDPDNKEYIRLSNSNKIIDWFI